MDNFIIYPRTKTDIAFINEMLTRLNIEFEKISDKPNLTTRKAMKDARTGKVSKAKNTKDLIDKLNN